VELAGLQPDHRVLDVGCGFGRVARPLVGDLGTDHGAAYIGFDVDAVAVGWCQARYPDHFHFVLADLFNPRWHPTGTGKASEYRFPAEDASVDVVAMTSVLTHLLEQEAGHYLDEIARVLRPGGRALLTLFVLDDGSREAMAEELALRHFLQPHEHVAVLRDELPEEAVAYDVGWLRERLVGAGLRPRADVRPGIWRGDGTAPTFHDVLVVER
jgi:SAM-dependent methyltransferase